MYRNALILAFAAAVLMAAMMPVVSAAQTESEVATLEVVGRAKVVLEANIAVLSFSVVTSARSASEAVKQNAQQTQSMLDQLRRQMGPEDQINTARFNLQPVYEKSDRYRPEGYRVENQVVLKTRLLEKVGTFIDSAVEAGADQIGRLYFSNDKEMEARILAREKAVENARRQATELAAAADLGLVRVLKIREVDQGGPAPMRMAMEAGAGGTPTPILAGELEVETAVEMIFEIR